MANIDMTQQAGEIIFARDIGWAVLMLRTRHKVARRGWNGRGMYLFAEPAGIYEMSNGYQYPQNPFVWMKAADDTVVPWLASQTDLLAQDWEEVAA